MSYILR